MMALLRDRQTELTPLACPRRLKPESHAETGRSIFYTHNRPKLSRLFLFFAVFICLMSSGLAQDQLSEYDVKAAFLFNFAKFVEWPPDAFAATNSPIVVGVLGKNVFGDSLEKIIRDRKVNNRSFQFRNFDTAAEATNCHILFISASEKDDYAQIVTALHNASILTVSEDDGFLKAGGMINFLIENKNIRFQISDEAAKKARLKISSKLLSLAATSR